MNTADRQRFEQLVQQSGDVDAALATLGQGLPDAENSPSQVDIDARLLRAAEQALADEKAAR